MIKKILHRVYSTWFYIGVNVIGIPEMIKHENRVYINEPKTNYDNRKTKIKNV